MVRYINNEKLVLYKGVFFVNILFFLYKVLLIICLLIKLKCYITTKDCFFIQKKIRFIII